MNSLFEFRNKRRIVAKNGGNGENELCGGKNATDLYVKVPLGTQVYDAKNNKLIVDIVKSDQQFILCFGGRGGHGNAYFKSVKNVAPSLHENGEIGEEINAILKLKFIADIGIIGLPNAGKSTLISTITNAHPKIANYQFTTLTPVLGIVNHNGKKIVFADIPGLIEGAAEGKGLGHDFLKHIERCNILIHLISGSCDDNKNILKAYETINEELKKYSKKISQKKMIVVINKSDIEESELNYEELKKNINGKVFLISALEKKGINELLTYIFNKYKPKKIILKKEKAREREYTKTAKIIRADKHTWEVKSDYLKY
jgi:GTP-binding protein